MYPEVGIALPVAVTFLRIDKALPWIKFYDSAFGIELVLAHLIITLPLTTWILVGTFDTIPREMEEAASVDGASRIGTVMRVVIPLAAPGIAVATIFSWLASWDEVTYAIYLTLFNRTLPLEIVNIVGRSPPPVIATYATLVTIPVLFVTYFLQRWLKAGYLAGAIKG
jgi:trehalose transport system permease protein